MLTLLELLEILLMLYIIANRSPIMLLWKWPNIMYVRAKHRKKCRRVYLLLRDFLSA